MPAIGRSTTRRTGPSAGLAFFLLLAARLLGMPPASDVVASATCDAWGGVGPVEGLEVKVPVLLNLGPRFRRLVVAVSQAELARALSGDALQDEARRMESGGHRVAILPAG